MQEYVLPKLFVPGASPPTVLKSVLDVLDGHILSPQYLRSKMTLDIQSSMGTHSTTSNAAMHTLVLESQASIRHFEVRNIDSILVEHDARKPAMSCR